MTNSICRRDTSRDKGCTEGALSLSLPLILTLSLSLCHLDGARMLSLPLYPIPSARRRREETPMLMELED